MKFVIACALVALCLAEHHDPLSDKKHFKGSGARPEIRSRSLSWKGCCRRIRRADPEKSKERLGKLVPKMDSNGDGVIEENELKDHINFMQKRYVNNDVERTWKNYKEDKIVDGKITWAAYREMVYGHPTGENQEISDQYKKMLVRDEKRWAASDYDSSGTLDRTEYGCFMHPRRLRAHATRTDTSTSRSTSEICTARRITLNSTERSRDWVASEREMFKEHRDKDNDGKLNQNEMRSPLDGESLMITRTENYLTMKLSLITIPSSDPKPRIMESNCRSTTLLTSK
ncbi:unnamed protein product, partial [Mesorhabditis spiculigera]